jgi:hypothetical protein
MPKILTALKETKLQIFVIHENITSDTRDLFCHV